MNKNTLHDVYLGLGSNLGDKENNIHSALEKINEKIGRVISLSSFYITDPVGFISENTFINAACHVQTRLEPLAILQLTQDIEKELGRITKSKNNKYSDRTIDIDILMFDNIILNSEPLVLPHPHLHDRSFVILPLEEIASNIQHPVLNKTIGEIRKDFEKNV